MNARKHQPERTCIGCRGVFRKDEVVRVVAGPSGIVIDYREKLPGRAAYVCPRQECLAKALSKDNFSRALHTKAKSPAVDDFLAFLTASINEKVRSLIAMASKAGKLAAGYSAVQDALEKGKADLLIYAEDIAAGTREKVDAGKASGLRETTLLTRDELGKILNRELIGVIAIEDKGFADALWREAERLKSLINISH